VLFVGGGFVSFEFAHIAARAGARPTIIDRGARPLKDFDPDLVELLVARGADVGIDMRPQTTITSIQRTGSAHRVTIETAGSEAEIEADLSFTARGASPSSPRSSSAPPTSPTATGE
jgi:glutathione reductase (NADPH)